MCCFVGVPFFGGCRILRKLCFFAFTPGSFNIGLLADSIQEYFGKPGADDFRFGRDASEKGPVVSKDGTNENIHALQTNQKGEKR